MVEASVLVGEPKMAQLVGLIDAQPGSVGLDEQLVMAAPLALSVVGETSMADPTLPDVPVAPA